MEERRFPDAMPQPTDETYPVASTVGHWSELPQTERIVQTSYEIGEEVAAAPFRVDAQSWREIVADVNTPPKESPRDAAGPADDDYGLGPKTDVVLTRTAATAQVKLGAAASMRQAADARIGNYSDPKRFTLRGLLFVFTLASVVFAVGARMPRGMFAGTAGLAALLTAVGSRWLMGESAPAKIAWLTLMAVYLLTSFFALLQL